MAMIPSTRRPAVKIAGSCTVNPWTIACTSLTPAHKPAISKQHRAVRAQVGQHPRPHLCRGIACIQRTRPALQQLMVWPRRARCREPTALSPEMG